MLFNQDERKELFGEYKPTIVEIDKEFKTYKNAVDAGFLLPGFCFLDNTYNINCDKKQDRQLVFIGVISSEQTKTFPSIETKSFWRASSIYGAINYGGYFTTQQFGAVNLNAYKNQNPYSLPENTVYSTLPFVKDQPFLVFYDTAKDASNLSDNLVFSTCIARGGCELESVFYNNLGANILDAPEKRNPKTILDRATIMYQILSQFDYQSASEQEKELLFDMRLNTVKMLLNFYLPCYTSPVSFSGYTDGYILDTLKHKYDLKYDFGVKSHFNADLRNFKNFEKDFVETATNKSLSDLIEFCKTEPENVFKKAEQSKIKKDLKQRKKEEAELMELEKAKAKKEKQKQEKYKL